MSSSGTRLLTFLLSFLAWHAAHATDTELVKASDGTVLEVFAEGSGPLLVILPSAGRGADDYDAVAPLFAKEGFRVVRPQPRGIGRSTGKIDGITLGDLAADIEAVIQHEKNGPAVIVGHAFGNWVARYVASDRPDQVRGVVIAAAAAKKFPKELYTALAKSADVSLPAAERLPYIQSTFFAKGHDASAWLQGWHTSVQKYQVEAANRSRVDFWWAGGHAPLLEVQASEDPFKIEAQRGELKAELGDRVTTVLIEGASHALIPEKPQEFVQAVTSWAKSLPR